MDFITDEITAQTMSELEKTQKEFWNIPRKTGVLINMMIKMMKAQSVLEIGTSNGYSAIWLALALKETKGHLTTIEFWDKRQSVAIENFKACGLYDVIEPRLGPAFAVLDNIANEIKESKRSLFDFVFIDANKKEYIDYFKQIDPILNNEGLILADNMLSHKEKVQPFYDEIMNNKKYKSVLLPVGTGILMAVKN